MSQPTSPPRDIARSMGRGTPNTPGPAGDSAGMAGFSLIELMVAMTLFTIVLVGVLGVLFNIQTSWTTSSNQIRANTNERASIDLMANDIRMAGSGFGGIAAVTPGVPGGRVYPLEPRPGHSAPDTLLVTGALTGATTALTARQVSPGADIVVADVTQFAVDDLIVVCSGGDANLFQVTGINAATKVLEHSAASAYNATAGHVPWPNGGYNIAARVARVSRVAYWISEDGDTGLKTLMRRDGTSDPVAVANNVQWMSLRYVLSNSAVSNNPGDPGTIRSVLLDYVSPSLAEGHASQSDTLSMRIQPRVLS